MDLLLQQQSRHSSRLVRTVTLPAWRPPAQASKLVIGMEGEETDSPAFVRHHDRFKSESDSRPRRGHEDIPPPKAPAPTRGRCAVNRDSISRIIHGLIVIKNGLTAPAGAHPRVGDQLISATRTSTCAASAPKSLNKFLASLPELEVEERILR